MFVPCEAKNGYGNVPTQDHKHENHDGDRYKEEKADYQQGENVHHYW